RPDTQLILRHLAITFKDYACLHQVLDRSGDIRNLPAQHRSLNRGALLADGEAQHDPIGFEHQREWRLFTNETQAERVAIELLRPRDVDNVDESDNVEFAESGMRHAPIMHRTQDCRKTLIASEYIANATSKR